MAETTIQEVAAKMIERFQLSPKESINIETHLRTVEREALKRAVKVAKDHATARGLISGDDSMAARCLHVLAAELASMNGDSQT
jgi:hypothetical protein